MVSDFIAKKNRVVKDYKLADNSVPEETKKKLRSRLNICEISCTKFGEKKPNTDSKKQYENNNVSRWKRKTLIN